MSAFDRSVLRAARSWRWPERLSLPGVRVASAAPELASCAGWPRLGAAEKPPRAASPALLPDAGWAAGRAAAGRAADRPMPETEEAELLARFEKVRWSAERELRSSFAVEAMMPPARSTPLPTAT